MHKYKFLLFKTIFLTLLLFNGQKVFANEHKEAKVLKDSEGQDWIDKVMEEIRSVDLRDFEDKTEVKADDQKERKF